MTHLNLKNQKDLTNIKLLCVCFFLVISQMLLNVHLLKITSTPEQIPLERQQKLDPVLFQTITFGHLAVAIDWLWMNCLMDSSLEHVKPGYHPQLYYDLDLLTDLDPANQESYYVGANLLAVVRNDGTGARDLLLKGNDFIKKELPQYSDSFRNRFWGSNWKLPLLLAYVYLFELNDMRHAAEAFRQAAAINDAPPYLIRLEKRLQRPGGEYEVGLKLLNFLISNYTDTRVRAGLEKKKMNLFIGQYLFELNHGFQEFLVSQPGYRNQGTLTSAQMESYWKSYRRAHQVSEKDPWGGHISLNPAGKVISTTPHESVFGLE